MLSEHTRRQAKKRRRTTTFRLAPLLVAGLLAAYGCSTTYTSAPAPQQSRAASWIARPALYEVFTRDFSPEGNFKGLINGLDRIQATGVNVIWLMPIHPVGVLNRKGEHGSSYSVRDYRAINPEYGTEEDFRSLVRAVHARDMKLIIDWVPNHTAWDHVWVTAHPNRYVRNQRGELTVPHDNEGKPTDWTDVADLDYSNPDLRQAMITDMRYWLQTFDIDGFRVDVAGFVPDDFWREALPQLRAVKPILLLAEWGDLKMHQLGFDLSYGWDAYGKLKGVWKGEPAVSFVQREIQERSAMPAGGRRLRFTTNHDETAWDQPPPTLFGGSAGARAAFVAMALMPGVPLLYNGQEVESSQKLGLFEKQPVAWDQPNAAETRAFYRRIIDLARTDTAFTQGELSAVETDAANDVIAYKRGNTLVLVNTRPRAIRINLSGHNVIGMRDVFTRVALSTNHVALEPYGFTILR